MSSYAAEKYMAWIVEVSPSVRHPKPRWQVRYRDVAGRERSGGIYNNPKAAETIRKRIDRGLPPTLEDESPDPVGTAKARTLFGDYVTTVWWLTWKAQHPDSAYCVGNASRSGSSPRSGTPFAAMDADQIGAWKASLVTDGLKPATVNTYLSLLGTILNAAVDSDYLPHSPLLRKSRAGRVGAARNLPMARRKVWITRSQFDRLAETIEPRYHALLKLAALTGLRWGELAALRWEDVRLDQPLEDGAVTGSGRLRVVRAFSDPSRTGRGRFKGPKTEAARRTIALERAGRGELHHPWAAWRAVQPPADRSGVHHAGGSRGSGGPLAANNFRRVWRRTLQQAGLDDGWPEYGGLRFHDLRDSHATWLLALRVPMIAVSNRLGHANPVITMMIYAHVDKQVDRGLLTRDELGLPPCDRNAEHDHHDDTSCTDRGH
jgi:integrase